MHHIQITTEYITLGQFLKLADIVSDGGQAKHLIAEGNVSVNDVVEVRRGRKLYPNDVVSFEGVSYTVTRHED